MDPVKMLSDEMVTIPVENDFKVTVPKSSVTKVLSSISMMSEYVFTYYKVTTRDNVYRVSEVEGDEKIKAINNGAKFVSLENDIVNINEIKTFSKKTAHKGSI